MNGNKLPAVEQLGGGQILLRGAAVADALYLARYGVRAARQNGIASPRFALLLKALEHETRLMIEAVSANGPTDVRTRSESARWEPNESLSSSEVAVMMQCTDRHIRRIAPTLGGVKVGRRWVFSRLEVTAYLADREMVTA